jgi:DNA-binding transcriptional MerR regulator
MPSMLYSMKNATELYDVSPTTIKNYCDLAVEYLSDHARPDKKNGRRWFTYDDLRVFALIKSSRDYQAATAALASGERGEVPSMHNEYTITIQQKQQVMFLQNRVIQLEAELERFKGVEKERDEAVGHYKATKDRLNEKEAELFDVKHELANLKQLHLNLKFREPD